MELESNMYVRTPYGIDKIKDIVLNGSLYEDSGLYLEKGIKLVCGKEEIKNLKARYDIIDLIEVGDYVNGSKVIDISMIGKDKEKWVWVEEMEDTDNKYGDDYVGYNNDQIKSIVTKEQFEAMAYKVV